MLAQLDVTPPGIGKASRHIDCDRGVRSKITSLIAVIVNPLE